MSLPELRERLGGRKLKPSREYLRDLANPRPGHGEDLQIAKDLIEQPEAGFVQTDGRVVLFGNDRRLVLEQTVSASVAISLAITLFRDRDGA